MILPIALGVVTISMALATGWLLLQLRQSQERIVSRLEALSTRPPIRAAADTPAIPSRPAPVFTLPALDGRTVSLHSLLARSKRTLINFTDPKCGPCFEHLADVGGWERAYGDRLTIVTVSSGDARTNQLLAGEYGLGTVLLQQGHELTDAYGLAMLPSAVLLEPDGRVIDTANGAPRVRDLVASALGLTVPARDETQIRALRPGQPVGRLRRPDLDGNLIDIGSIRTNPTLLVFWSPGCSHCQDLLPLMREWDAEAGGPHMVVVTSGPAGLNRDVGLRAPMIQDDEGVLKRTFGVPGTPAAVLIDRNGTVASDVARGTTGVRALVAHAFGRSIVAA